MGPLVYCSPPRAPPHHTRITPALLKHWKAMDTSSTSVNMKCLIVDTSALDALPEYPLDLAKWIIPKEVLVLPADIYTDGILNGDDGHDRAKLNAPGVLHIERTAKWSHERLAQSFPAAPAAPVIHTIRSQPLRSPRQSCRHIDSRPSAAPAAPSRIVLPHTDTQRVANANVGHSIALEMGKTIRRMTVRT